MVRRIGLALSSVNGSRALEQVLRSVVDDAAYGGALLAQPKPPLIRELSREERQAARAILQGSPIIQINDEVIKASAGETAIASAQRWVAENIPSGMVFREGIGEVIVDSSGVKNSMSHGFGQTKLDALQAVPNVILDGAYLGEASDLTGKEIDNIYLAAPITIGEIDHMLFVRLRRDVNGTRFYVHETFLEDEIKNERDAKQTLAKLLRSKPQGGTALYKSIVATVLEVNSDEHPADTTNFEPTSSKSVDEAEPLRRQPKAISFSDLAGAKINSRRTAFSDAAGSLGISRNQMPQVSAEHRGALANFLKGRGINWNNADVLPGTLRPTQADYNPGKVKKAMDWVGESERRILVSSDDRVIDGHHQWMAHLSKTPSTPMAVVRLQAPATAILSQIHEFPSAGMEKAPDIETPASPEQQQWDSAYQSLVALPQRAQDVILPLLDGATVEDVSESLGIPVEAVEKVARVGVSRLKASEVLRSQPLANREPFRYPFTNDNGANQVQRGTDEGNPLQESATFARRGANSGQTSGLGGKEFKGAFAAFVDWANERGMIREFPVLETTPTARGQEHEVWFDAGTKRWTKATYANRFGEGLGKENATVADYLERLHLQNALP